MGGGFGPLCLRIGVGVAGGVFRAVQCLFERPVAAADPVPSGVRHLQQPFGIVSAQGPDHDVEAFVNDLARIQRQTGHCPTGRGRQKGGGLVAQHDLAQLHLLAGRPQRQPRAHGIGAAPERIEHGPHGSTLSQSHAVSTDPTVATSTELAATRRARPYILAKI